MLCLSVPKKGKLVMTTAAGERIEIVNLDKLRHRVGVKAPTSVQVVRDGAKRKEAKCGDY